MKRMVARVLRIAPLLLVVIRPQAGHAEACPMSSLLSTGSCERTLTGQERKTASAPESTANEFQKASRLATQGMLPQAAGASTGLAMDAVDEAVQILGQIVVDRASAEAFRLMEDRLEALLGCTVPTSAKYFKATCAAILTIRIQDLASAPQALTTALLQDLASDVFPRLSMTAEPEQILAFMKRDIAPLFAQSSHGLDSTAATLLASRLRMQGSSTLATTAASPSTEACSPSTDLASANAALGFASAGVGACFLQTDYPSPADCPVVAVVDKLFSTACPTGDPSIRDLAVKLALEIQTALTATDKNKPDVKSRLRSANDATFDYLCASLDFVNACIVVDSDSHANLKNELADLHAIWAAVIGQDVLQIVLETATLLERVIVDVDKTKHRRAFRLLGGLLDYTSTFNPAPTASTTALSSATSSTVSMHDKRTKILESLTRDMTDRTGRLGDTIWSLGGALRATSGWWFRSKGDGAYLGPLSLTLGVGLDVYAQDAARGFHFEASAVDLARYLSYQNGGKVNDVKVTDVFTPGIGAAYFFGASLPLTVGIRGSYSPRYQFADEATRAFSVALEVGLYVPLIDIN